MFPFSWIEELEQKRRKGGTKLRLRRVYEERYCKSQAQGFLRIMTRLKEIFNYVRPSSTIKLDDACQEDSYTEVVTSLAYSLSLLWSATIAYLYLRVQNTTRVRKRYIEDNYRLFHDSDDYVIIWETEEYFLTTGINEVIKNMQIAVHQVLKDKNTRVGLEEDELFQTISQIFEVFMSFGGPNYWVNYLIPENIGQDTKKTENFDHNLEKIPILPNVTKFEQLMFERRVVLSSSDFASVLEVSLTKMVKATTKEIVNNIGVVNSTSVSLDRLLLLHLKLPFLKELNKQKLLEVTFSEEVELFFKNLFTGGDSSVFESILGSELGETGFFAIGYTFGIFLLYIFGLLIRMM